MQSNPRLAHLLGAGLELSHMVLLIWRVLQACVGYRVSVNTRAGAFAGGLTTNLGSGSGSAVALWLLTC